jgi:mono/diheme cytochrome c family protein
MQLKIRPRWLVVAATTLLALASCFAEPPLEPGGPTARAGSGGIGGIGGMADEPTTAGQSGSETNACATRPLKAKAKCRPVDSAEPLYLRLVKDEPQDRPVFVEDLFSQFKVNCGGCHVDGNLGDTPLQVTLANFPLTVGQRVVDAIKSDVEECNDKAGCYNFMPPRSNSGKPWSEREGNEADSIQQFVTQLEEWLKQGSPPDVFILPAVKGGTSPYPVDEDFAASLTNIGSCIPDEGIVSTEPRKACDIDARFAEMKADPVAPALVDRIGLPATLDQTDLFTFDSAELARYGVVAYAPTYPLWTDDAGKLRYVRVPRGESIKFNKQTKLFDIPKNTRFYKTFLKEVTTLDGSRRYRKIETRVIVSRGNEESLFGTYEWNDEETQATLVTAPQRSGEPFTDVLKTLIIDEPKAADVNAQKAAGTIRNITYELDQQHAVRRYAIPGKERCIQCHQGNKDFILAFSPLQVARRACDQATLEEKGHCDGGVIHPAGADEVSQLERLISYGVITGFDPETDLQPLEAPQGTPEAPRPLRTPQELVAQGYILGNCAHCHNPIGYPTRQNPELGPLLNFMPGEEGGIFGFPLDRYSPRIRRGIHGDIQLPYITPSLRDIVPQDGCRPPTCDPKEVPVETGDPENPFGRAMIDAPWRSLIYRNVDTPFTYSEDYAIYPHMPLNSPGFDCRAPRILGSWMVSIPAKRKHPELNEEVATGLTGSDNEGQTYVEVKPGEPGYLNAVADTQKRLAVYLKGSRYTSYCPDTSDIVDLDVLRGKRLVPADATYKVNGTLKLPLDGVPDRPHWAVTDLSESPGAWTPRRTDWQKVFTTGLGEFPGKPSDSGYAEAKAAFEAEAKVVAMLKDIEITPALRAYAEKKLPFGLWREDPECQAELTKQPALSDYAVGAPRAAQHMEWMDLPKAQAKPNARVFETLPGAAIFNMICVNCHGPNADSQGRQAVTLQDMTGGTARVANFRDGLFGPTGTQGENRKRIFGTEAAASRYLPWMALGGTKVRIPLAILNLVANTDVLGETRGALWDSTGASANMLQVGQKLCRNVVLMSTGQGRIVSESIAEDRHKAPGGLIDANGDAALWEGVCSVDNPAPIRVFAVAAPAGGGNYIKFSQNDLYFPTHFPAATSVGNQLGEISTSLTADNAFPWCVLPPTTAEDQAWLATKKTKKGSPLPLCPAGFAVPANQYQRDETGVLVDVNKWATRGAINAGLAVFVYLDMLIGNNQPVPPRYNECKLLKAP